MGEQYADLSLKNIEDPGPGNVLSPHSLLTRGKKPKSKKPKPEKDEAKPDRKKKKSHKLFRGEGDLPLVQDIIQGPSNSCWIAVAPMAVLDTSNGVQFIKNLFDTSGPDVQIKVPGASSCYTITRQEAEETITKDGESTGGFQKVEGAS